MNATVSRLRRSREQIGGDKNSPQIVELVELHDDTLWIRLTEFSAPVPAQFLEGLFLTVQANASVAGRKALALFDHGNVTRPIIVGLLSESTTSQAKAEQRDLSATRPSMAFIDGKRVVLDASEEIVLQCGKGSLTLTADGKIVMKGVEIVSRALRSNKIKGGVVNIN